MSGFPDSPRLTKGALASLDLANPVPIPKVIVFQYNPESLSRTLQAQGISGSAGVRTEAYRLKGPPSEKIDLEIEIDATDKLEHSDQNPTATTMGIYPQLSALELMIYPTTSLVLQNAAMLSAGTLEIIPPVGPFTLFIYGAKRILPVRLTDIKITEQDHDTNLNPIRAKVSLGLQVLTYADLDSSHLGYRLSIVNQVLKEAMASIGSVSDPSFGLSTNPGLG